MNAQYLMETAKAMVPPGRGILAADESTRSTEKRFQKFDIPHTAETRRGLPHHDVHNPRAGEIHQRGDHV